MPCAPKTLGKRFSSLSLSRSLSLESDVLALREKYAYAFVDDYGVKSDNNSPIISSDKSRAQNFKWEQLRPFLLGLKANSLPTAPVAKTATPGVNTTGKKNEAALTEEQENQIEPLLKSIIAAYKAISVAYFEFEKLNNGKPFSSSQIKTLTELLHDTDETETNNALVSKEDKYPKLKTELKAAREEALGKIKKAEEEEKNAKPAVPTDELPRPTLGTLNNQPWTVTELNPKKIESELDPKPVEVFNPVEQKIASVPVEPEKIKTAEASTSTNEVDMEKFEADGVSLRYDSVLQFLNDYKEKDSPGGQNFTNAEIEALQESFDRAEASLKGNPYITQEKYPALFSKRQRVFDAINLANASVAKSETGEQLTEDQKNEIRTVAKTFNDALGGGVDLEILPHSYFMIYKDFSLNVFDATHVSAETKDSQLARNGDALQMIPRNNPTDAQLLLPKILPVDEAIRFLKEYYKIPTAAPVAEPAKTEAAKSVAEAPSEDALDNMILKAFMGESVDVNVFDQMSAKVQEAKNKAIDVLNTTPLFNQAKKETVKSSIDVKKDIFQKISAVAINSENWKNPNKGLFLNAMKIVSALKLAGLNDKVSDQIKVSLSQKIISVAQQKRPDGKYILEISEDKSEILVFDATEFKIAPAKNLR